MSTCLAWKSETVSKYAINILMDFRGKDTPMRPEAAQIFRRRGAWRHLACHCLPVGVPDAVLLSEPFKIVQSPWLTLIPV